MYPPPACAIVAANPLFSIKAVRILLPVNLNTEWAILSLIKVDFTCVAEGDVLRLLVASIIADVPPASRSISRRCPLAMRIRTKLPRKHRFD